MATGSPAIEVYSHRTTAGTALISRIALTGWGATPTSSAGLFAKSDHGRLWGRWDGTDTVTFYSRTTYASGVAVCTGTVSSGSVTLSASNTSGITGSLDITGQATDGTTSDFDVIVSYADENSLIKAYKQVANLLDSNSKYEGMGTRFEEPLKQAKREMDEWLVGKQDTIFSLDGWNRRELAAVSDPLQLEMVQAHLCVANMLGQRKQYDESKYHMDRARNLMASVRIAIDIDSDDSIDARPSLSGGKLRRA